MRLGRGFWLWGQFSPNCSNSLIKLQNKVQKELKSPKFNVHITLAGPYKTSDQLFKNSLYNFFKSVSSLKLNLTNYDYRDQVYRSFYISVFESIELKKLRSDINSLFPFNQDEIYSPHISLAYGNHCKNSKEKIISTIKDPPKIIVMNKVSIIDVNENESKWDVIESFNLK